MSYPYVLLGDYIDILSGFAFKSKDFSENGIPVVKIKNIVPPYVTLEDLSYVPNEIAKSNQKYLLTYNDVLIALTGSHINQMASVVGRIARVKYNIPSLLNQRVGKITVKNEGSCDINYVYYFLSQEQIKIALASKAGGAANQANISPSDIKKLIIPLPSIEIQRRIADILSAYDDLIENNRKQIKLLEEAAQRLYKEWFVDLHFPGNEHTKIVDGVPEGWETATLGDICSVRKETLSLSKIDDDVPYIGLEHMPRKDICLSEWGDSSEINSSKFRYYEDDILFGKIRPYFHKVGFALNSGVASTDAIILRNAKGLWSLLLMTVSSSEFVNYTYQNCKEGAKMPRADWKQMKSYPIMIADPTIQNTFENQIYTITRKIKCLALQIKRLSEARDRLLPKLMSGEVKV